MSLSDLLVQKAKEAEPCGMSPNFNGLHRNLAEIKNGLFVRRFADVQIFREAQLAASGSFANGRLEK
jgi:hypothetical protein